MTSRLSRTIAFLFITCALQLQVMAGTGLMGKLRTRDNKPVMVNGNKTASRTTILSGSRIQCPEKIGATVDLGSLGRLDLAPRTDLTLNFKANEVTVQLRSGYVVLTTNAGVRGAVETSDGLVFRTDTSKLSSVVVKTKGAVGPETAAEVGASSGGIGGGPAAGIGGAAAAVVGGAAAAKSGSRGNDLSSDNPRKP